MKFIYFFLIIPFLIIFPAYADFPLSSQNSNPVGIAYDPINNRFAILDNSDNIIYMYHNNGTALPDQNIQLESFTWLDLIIQNNIYQIVKLNSVTTTAYSLDGINLGSESALTFNTPFNNALTFNPQKYYTLTPSPSRINAYDIQSGDFLSGNSFDLSAYSTSTPNNFQFIDNYFFITYPGNNMIISFDVLGDYIAVQNIQMSSTSPQGLIFHENKIFVVDATFVREYDVRTRIDSITDLTGSSDSPATILLDWSAPLISSPISGYQINFTNPYSNNPNIILTNNTLSATSSVLVSNLNVGAEYSFRVAPYTEEGKGKVSNVLDYMTLHELKIGDVDLTESNPNKSGIRFESTEIENETIIQAVYNSGWDLQCFYRGTFSTVNATIPLSISPYSPTQSQAIMKFIDAENDIITITCRDNNSNGEGKFVISQKRFLIQDQIRDFRNGTFGTFGQIGPLDMFSVSLILFTMIAFNRLNESVGLIISIFIIGISLYLELISLETAIIPLVAFIIMIVIATTKKQ